MTTTIEKVITSAALQEIDVLGNDEADPAVAEMRLLAEQIGMDKKALERFDNAVKQMKESDSYALPILKNSDVYCVLEEAVKYCNAINSNEPKPIQTAWNIVLLLNTEI